MKDKGEVDFAVSFVYQKKIDSINIQKATVVAMRRAFKGLKQKTDYVIVDKIAYKRRLFQIKYETREKADRDIASVAAASIVGKVTRDAAMTRYDKKYPKYGFAAHKGYPTARHYAALKEYGVSPIHRRSFRLF